MTLKKVEVRLAAQVDIVAVRQAARSLAVEIGLSIIDQTMIVTAASELARNTVVYGGGGVATLEIVGDSGREGLHLIFDDSGPGIPDVERALQDGYSTGKSLGLGLGGAKRLCSEFSIRSQPGVGTNVSVIRWKS